MSDQPAPPTPPTAPLDHSVLDGWRELQTPNEPDVVQEVIQHYREASPGVVAALRAAIQRDDPAEVKRLAHSLKGSSGNIGALRVQKLCAKLEALGRGGLLEGADELIERLASEVERVNRLLLEELKPSPPAEPAAAEAPATRNILIVDDSASQRLLLASILKSAGYHDLTTADSAQSAFTKLGLEGEPSQAGADIDLVLMDISMPEMDGIEACRRIKSIEASRDLPVIMVTASAEPDDLQLAFDAGAIDYITKPLNRVELLARVRSSLRLKHEMDRRKAREAELVQVNQRLEHTLTSLDDQHRLLQAEQARSERLLLNILPKPIADRLKVEQGVIADSFPQVTVLFADIVDFTRLAAQASAGEVVALLNDVFSRFDQLAEKHGLEKIKTIGDAYMAVGGLPTPRADDAEAVAEMALDMREIMAGQKRMTGSLLNLRIGIHTGPVVAGVIGTKKFIYDLWGDTVNIASRMEALGASGGIQVSQALFQRLRDRYRFEERGPVNVKGKGDMMTYLLVGRKNDPELPAS
jgi:class 3 adenylate cyclase/HPt (histidine-containing phosphotransfer) domain-containing protein